MQVLRHRPGGSAFHCSRLHSPVSAQCVIGFALSSLFSSLVTVCQYYCSNIKKFCSRISQLHYRFPVPEIRLMSRLLSIDERLDTLD